MSETWRPRRGEGYAACAVAAASLPTFSADGESRPSETRSPRVGARKNLFWAGRDARPYERGAALILLWEGTEALPYGYPKECYRVVSAWNAPWSGGDRALPLRVLCGECVPPVSAERPPGARSPHPEMRNLFSARNAKNLRLLPWGGQQAGQLLPGAGEGIERVFSPIPRKEYIWSRKF